MLLSMTGTIPLRIGNYRPDAAVLKSKMTAATLVVNTDVTVPCIIRKTAYGNVERLNSEPVSTVSIIVYNRLRHTEHTRLHFVDVLITTKPVQFSVYIHTDNLNSFFANCAMSAIRAGQLY